MPGVTTVTVGPAEAGQKLLNFLDRRLDKQVPHSALMRWIRTGQVRLDGKRTKPFTRVDQGQKVRIPPYTPAEKDSPEEVLETTSNELETAYEDPELLIINKPAGLPVHPGTKNPDSVTARLKLVFPDAPFAPTPAHRLDKNTTGALAVAKTYRMLNKLHGLIRTGKIQKTYLAWVAGAWPYKREITLRDRLEKTGPPGRQKVRAGHGKPAESKVLPVRPDKDKTLLEVRLLTGRTHQIRAQLAARGHPVIGDPRYGGPKSPHGLLLHAYRLAWPGFEITMPPPWPAELRP